MRFGFDSLLRIGSLDQESRRFGRTGNISSAGYFDGIELPVITHPGIFFSQGFRDFVFRTRRILVREDFVGR